MAHTVALLLALACATNLAAATQDAAAWDMSGASDFEMHATVSRDGLANTGTIFGRALPTTDGHAGGLWANGGSAGQGKMLFLRQGKACFDIGWVGVICGRTFIDIGANHTVGVKFSGGKYHVTVDGRVEASGLRAVKDRAGDIWVQGARIGHKGRPTSMAPDFEGSIHGVTYTAATAATAPATTTTTAATPATTTTVEPTTLLFPKLDFDTTDHAQLEAKLRKELQGHGVADSASMPIQFARGSIVATLYAKTKADAAIILKNTQKIVDDVAAAVTPTNACVDTRASGSGLHGDDSRGSYANGLSSQCAYYKNKNECGTWGKGCEKTCGLCSSSSEAPTTAAAATTAPCTADQGEQQRQALAALQSTADAIVASAKEVAAQIKTVDLDTALVEAELRALDDALGAKGSQGYLC